MVCAWRYVVLDEGHRIKNYKSNIAKALLSLNAEYRMILTGTPLQNNLVEMWALFHWLLPEIFVDNTLPLFKNAFDLTKGIVNQSVLDHSRRLLELIMLRRMKSSPGVDLNLPRKDIVRLFVPLTPLQKNWYLRMLTQQSDDMLQEIYRSAQDKEKGSMRSVNIRNDSVHPSRTDAPSMQLNGTVAHDREVQDLQGNTPAKDSWRRLLNLVLQLRKVCTHPYLIPDAAPEVNRIGSHVFENSGKFMALQKLIQELVVHQGKKIIIFSNFTQVLDWVQDLVTYISEDGLKFQSIRLDGNTLRAKRNLYVRLFQQPNSAYKIFLISTKAGGIGLTLTAATEAVFLDEDWNPQVDLQAEARCHRIGQTKPVTIYKLCTSGTVEEQMLGRIHKKLYLSAKITEAMENIHDPSMAKQEGEQLTVAQSKSLFGTYSEFKSLLRRGTQTLAGDGIDTEEMLNWDFETMLKKCQQTLDPATVEEDADENAWLSTMERVECAVFDGQRYARERLVSNGSLMTPSSSRKDRRKGKELTVEIDGYSVNKASLQCGEWEAAQILAGNDPALKDIKRTRLVIQNQEVSAYRTRRYIEMLADEDTAMPNL
jgi:SWI/SNF-related matrix-associated actin-dependent regulator of chromatin subfamily A member 5